VATCPQDKTSPETHTIAHVDDKTNLPFIYGEAIVDTGASTNLISPKFEKYMTSTRESKARIQGFEGSNEIRGRKYGTGHLYVLGTHKGQHGFQLTTNFDFVGNINSNLFSVSSLYHDHQFSIHFHARNSQDGRCELSRTLGDGTKQQIPIEYDASKSAFMIRFVMGLDKKRVVQYGREIERRRGLSLVDHMKMDNIHERCNSILLTSTSTPSIAIGRNINKTELNKLGTIIATHDATRFIPTNFNHTIYTIKYDDLDDACEPEGKESDEKSKRDWDKIMTHEMESVLLGAKAGLKSRERKMSELELHMRHGHVGRSGGKCTICNLLRGSFRRIYSKISPYFEQRIGHTFSGDVITWSDESRQGSKYCMVMRDFGSGFFFVIHLSKRNEVTRKLEALVSQIRADPIFKGHKHQIMSTLKLDPAGEWRNDNENFHTMASRIGINIKYSSPDDKRSHAHGENAVKQIEITT